LDFQLRAEHKLLPEYIQKQNNNYLTKSLMTSLGVAIASLATALEKGLIPSIRLIGCSIISFSRDILVYRILGKNAFGVRSL
jgi:hypothetical protein